MREMAKYIFQILTVISTICSILAFFGYGARGQDIWLLFLGLLLLVPLGYLLFKKCVQLGNSKKSVDNDKTDNTDRIYKNDDIDVSRIVPYSIKLASLICDLNKEKWQNNICANTLRYSYKIKEENTVEISIDIIGITECSNKFIMGLLFNDNTDVRIKIKNITYVPSNQKQENQYTIYEFDLPQSNFRAMKIVIIERYDLSTSENNLFFYPKNYIRNTNFIALNLPKKQYNIFKLKNNKYCSPKTIPYNENVKTIEINDDNKLDDVFWFERYNL